MTAQFKDYLNNSLVAYESYLENKGYKGNAMLTIERRGKIHMFLGGARLR